MSHRLAVVGLPTGYRLRALIRRANVNQRDALALLALDYAETLNEAGLLSPKGLRAVKDAFVKRHWRHSVPVSR